MQIVDTLKGAKPFLSTDYCDGKTPCICYAITDYVGSVYGRGLVYSDSSEAYAIRDAAQRHVMQELAKLTDAVMFDYKAADKVLGDAYDADSYTYVQEQKARHLCLTN